MNPIVLFIAGGFLAFGVLASVVRMMKGPSVLDRATASDTILGAIICVIGLEMVINKHTYTLPVLLAISAFAMLGTVSIAKFIHRGSREALTPPHIDELEEIDNRGGATEKSQREGSEQ